jgi:replicative DNA helicase
VGKSAEILAVQDGRLTITASDPAWKVGEREVFEVRLASGRTIRATKDHRLLAFGGWKTVGQLGIGDRLAIARSLPEPVDPVQWPEEKIIFLAHMIGDGSYLPGQPVRYTTGSDENSAAVWNAAKRLFPDCTILRRQGPGNWHQLEIGAHGNRWHIGAVREWFSEFGIYDQRSQQKRIPEEVFRLEKAQAALFLRHLWATDGTICNQKSGFVAIAFDTCSRHLVWDVTALLLRFGIVARVRPSTGPRGRPWWHLTITGADAQLRFLREIGAFGPRRAPAEIALARLCVRQPNTNVDTICREVFGRVRALMTAQGITRRRMASMRGTAYGGTAHFAFAPSRAVVAGYARLLNAPDLARLAESDLFWDRIVSIEPAGVEEVFDLTVPGPSCWLADGIVSHNSGALEQDSDTILFIYREEVYEKEKEEVKGIAEIIIGKQRNGPIGDLNLAFIHEHTRFENLAREYMSPGE